MKTKELERRISHKKRLLLAKSYHNEDRKLKINKKKKHDVQKGILLRHL